MSMSDVADTAVRYRKAVKRYLGFVEEAATWGDDSTDFDDRGPTPMERAYGKMVMWGDLLDKAIAAERAEARKRRRHLRAPPAGA